MGCGSSIPVASSINKKKPSTKSLTTNENSRVKSGKLPPIVKKENCDEERNENLEPLTLVCFDENLNENDKQLRSIIDYLCCFDDLDQCEQFLTNVAQQSTFIFLIISTEHFNNIISHIHHLPQIISIYVTQQYQSNSFKQQNLDQQMIKRYSKVKGIYSDRHLLLDQLSADVDISLNINDLIPLTVYNRLDAIQTNVNSVDHLRFLFYQLFIHQYCVNPSSTSSLNQNDFVEFLHSYYSSNRRQLKLLDQFNDEYNCSGDVVQWWQKNSFLRRILTQSLLQLNIPILFSLRFFLRDMLKSMINNHESPLNQKSNYFSSNGSNRYVSGRLINEQIFYRGQALAKETFLKIKSNIGEILSMNDFLLASRSRPNSLRFLREQIPTNDSIYRVLFELKIPGDYSLQKQRPFIYLNDSNKTADDKDELFSILFFIGSIFRINSTNFDLNNDSWIIQMTLYDEQLNEDFAPMFTFLHDKKRTENENTTVLANLLRQISPNSAEQFYKHSLKETNNSLSKVECYRGLGLCSYSQNDYDRALTYFQQALRFQPNETSVRSSLYHNLGLVYAQQNETEEALKHFHQALENSSAPIHRACVHHNIALVHSQQGQYQQELEHYEEALQIRTRQLPNHQLPMASLQNNIGIAYSDLQQYDRALVNLQLALQTRLKLLPDHHIDVARTYANIGTVYGKTKEFKLALDYFNKAQPLFEKQSQLPEEDLQQLNRNIKIINDKLRRKTR